MGGEPDVARGALGTLRGTLKWELPSHQPSGSTSSSFCPMPLGATSPPSPSRGEDHVPRAWNQGAGSPRVWGLQAGLRNLSATGTQQAPRHVSLVCNRRSGKAGLPRKPGARRPGPPLRPASVSPSRNRRLAGVNNSCSSPWVTEDTGCARRAHGRPVACRRTCAEGSPLSAAAVTSLRVVKHS